MTDVAASTMATVKAVQLALQVINSLSLTEWRYPPTCNFTNGSSYDFVIVGGGTAGSVLAERLTKNSSYSTFVVEAGSYSPLESEIAELFPTFPSTVYDYNITTEKDNKTALNLQNECFEMTAGKMLGGTSNLEHMLYVHPDPHDFDFYWSNAIGDGSWNYSNNQPFLKKQETLMDTIIKADPKCADLHGTSGPIKIARQPHASNANILAAAAELGHQVVNDTTSSIGVNGISEPLFGIYDQLRQSNAITYLGMAKGRTNLCIALSVTATKILIEDGVAIGVQFIDSSGNIYVIYAKKEVIISAGTINSAKLLMLSGIGNATHLKSFGIDVVADLPVGDNLRDHPSAMMVYQMEDNNSTNPPIKPYDFPVPATVLYAALNSSQTYPDYQDIILKFLHDSTAMVQLCSSAFKFKNIICNAWYEASQGKNIILVAHNLMMPKSQGRVRLASANYLDDPIVNLGTYTDPDGDDLDLMAKTLIDFQRINSTKSFRSVNAKFVDLGLCTDHTFGTYEYWVCYALEMFAGMWHFCGTCAMGSVVDSKLCVKNVTNLRVVDASVMPTLVSAKIKAVVNMIAERGAYFILDFWGITTQ